MSAAVKQKLYRELNEKLEGIILSHSLKGITRASARESFSLQLVDSIRRVQWIYKIRKRTISKCVINPSLIAFDPLKAAIYFKRNGELDESFWLVFLSIHFGKHKNRKWNMVRDVYGCLSQRPPLTWRSITQDFEGFESWLIANFGSIQRSFGNHRKYETLKPNSKFGLNKVMASYINWVGPDFDHFKLVQEGKTKVGDDPKDLFAYFYNSMNKVLRFGRTAKFDYLTMLGKIGLINIEPRITYMEGATGPKKGATLLFKGDRKETIPIAELERRLIRLEEILGLGQMGMQVLEDALCNWQKSPSLYLLFRG